MSQFENHVRAVCGLEQIPLKKISNAKMMNLIGDQITHYRNIQKFNDNEFFFDYLCLLYTSPSPRDYAASRMPSSA